MLKGTVIIGEWICVGVMSLVNKLNNFIPTIFFIIIQESMREETRVKKNFL